MTLKYHLLLLTFIALSCQQSVSTKFELLESDYTGITFQNTIIQKDTFNILQNEYMYNGGGVGVGDLDNDGLSEIILCGNVVSSKIYHNKGNFRFEDITSSLINYDSSTWVSGVNVIDINNDGWNDIYFTCTQGNFPLQRKNQLWINQGINSVGNSPTFIEEADKWNIADSSHSVHSAFFDADLDGDLDLYILNNTIHKKVPIAYRPKVKDGTSPNSDHFYLNTGNNSFVSSSVESGIVNEGYGLGIAISDLNQDGYPDIYVSNDYIANDLLYVNNGDGTFQNQIDKYISYQSRFSMGNDISDINNDGLADIMTLDMLPEGRERTHQTISSNNYTIYINDKKFDYEPQYSRNMLHLNQGISNEDIIKFSEIGQISGIHNSEWSWSTLMADFNNSGFKDIIITNGFPKDVTDKDFANYKTQMYGYLLDEHQVIEKIPVAKVTNFAFEQKEALSFNKVTSEWGMDRPSFSYGAAYADLDNDGDLDYICNNINDPAFIYRNRTIDKTPNEKANYIKIRLQGLNGNTQGIGTKTTVYTEGKVLFQEHYLSRGYLSSVDQVLHFGLGEISMIDSIEIDWNTGLSKLYQIQANQTIDVLQNDATEKTSVPHLDNRPLFTEVNQPNEFYHNQGDYIDFFQPQRIIPHKFSQIGPITAIADLDGDGVKEIIAASTNLNKVDLYNIKNGSIKLRPNTHTLNIIDNYIISDIKILDYDNDEDMDIVLSGGGYENEDSVLYSHHVLLNENGIYTTQRIPIESFVSSCMAISDYNKDGYDDIFIGRRLNRNEFPLAGPSILLTNNSGNPADATHEELNIGMVNDAVWADLNRDSWEDLIVVGEWNSVQVIYNNEGKLEDNPVNLLPGIKGGWRKVSVADLDDDGDQDLILGNMGVNHRFDVSENSPLKVYISDVDNNNTIDPIFTSFYKNEVGELKEYPVHFWDEMMAQSPLFRSQFSSFAEYSKATITDLIPNYAKLEYVEINTLESGIIWNQNNQFNWSPLPMEAQLAPINEILVDDFNMDGLKDLILLGNDFSYDVTTGYLDGNRGLLLENNSDRSFSPVPQSKSGLNVSGQVGSAHIIEELDNKYLWIGINRDSSLLYKWNPTHQ